MRRYDTIHHFLASGDASGAAVLIGYPEGQGIFRREKGPAVADQLLYADQAV
jgi:hypothetical protein